MSREGVLVILGAVVILAPFLGVPYSFLFWILPIIGVAIVLLALSMRIRRFRREVPPTPRHEEPHPTV